MKCKVLFICFSFSLFFGCSSSNQTTFEEDKVYLSNLFDEIENISKSETCTNPLSWKFVAYGAKPCGGPQGFIPYSKHIDETMFLDLVRVYSRKEKLFNEKWAIISDCSLEVPPKKVECQNNTALLVYE